MYDYDYGYGYETATIESTSNVLQIFGTIGIIISILGLVLGILMLISMIKVFKKAGKPAWAVFIPIYNIIVLLNIANLPTWYIILYVIPIANIYAMYKTWAGICKMYGKGNGFAIAMLFVPFICLPMLAFSKSKSSVSETSINEQNIQNEMVNDSNLEVNNDIFNGLNQMENMQFNDSMMMEQLQSMEQPNVMEQLQPIEQQNVMEQPQSIEQSNINNSLKECPNCHVKIKSDSPVCFMCGTKLS